MKWIYQRSSHTTRFILFPWHRRTLNILELEELNSLAKSAYQRFNHQPYPKDLVIPWADLQAKPVALGCWWTNPWPGVMAFFGEPRWLLTDTRVHLEIEWGVLGTTEINVRICYLDVLGGVFVCFRSVSFRQISVFRYGLQFAVLRCSGQRWLQRWCQDPAAPWSDYQFTDDST